MSSSLEGKIYTSMESKMKKIVSFVREKKRRIFQNPISVKKSNIDSRFWVNGWITTLESRKFLNRDWLFIQQCYRTRVDIWVLYTRTKTGAKCQWLSDSLFYMRYILTTICLGTWHHKRDESYVLFSHFPTSNFAISRIIIYICSTNFCPQQNFFIFQQLCKFSLKNNKTHIYLNDYL